MGINPHQLTELIIRPACEAIGKGGLAAEQIVLGTACQESHCGEFIHQVGGGPALGPWQMEPATHDDIHENYIRFKPQLRIAINNLCVKIADPTEMVWNLRYAAAMCRVHYLRSPAPLPSAGDTRSQALYWKLYYNTPKGAGTVDEYLANWKHFTGG